MVEDVGEEVEDAFVFALNVLRDARRSNQPRCHSDHVLRLDWAPEKNSARIAARVCHGCATFAVSNAPHSRSNVQPWPPLPNHSYSLANLFMNSCVLSGSGKWMRQSKKHRTTAILPFRSRESRRS